MTLEEAKRKLKVEHDETEGFIGVAAGEVNGYQSLVAVLDKDKEFPDEYEGFPLYTLVLEWRGK